MTTKNQDKKPRTGKAPAKKARVSKAESKSKESIGFLAAARKAHISVIEIPLTFMADLGIAPDKVRSARKLNKKFANGMYDNFEGITTKIGDTVSIPGKLIDKLQKVAAAKSKASPAKPKAKAKSAKSKPKAKATTSKAKPKVAAKPKAAAKPRTAVKPKAAVKSKAAAKPKTGAKPKASAKSKVAAKPKVATGPKPTNKAIAAAPPARSNLNADVRLRSV